MRTTSITFKANFFFGFSNGRIWNRDYVFRLVNEHFWHILIDSKYQIKIIRIWILLMYNANCWQHDILVASLLILIKFNFNPAINYDVSTIEIDA